MKQHPPRQIFKTLVNKNVIKRKIGGPPLAIFPETLDPPPPQVFWQKLQVPPPGFSTRVHLWPLVVKIPTKLTAIVSQSSLDVDFYIVRLDEFKVKPVSGSILKINVDSIAVVFFRPLGNLHGHSLSSILGGQPVPGVFLDRVNIPTYIN